MCALFCFSNEIQSDKRNPFENKQRVGVPNGGEPLLEADAIRQRGPDVDEVESPGNDGDHQDDDGEDEGEPKCGLAHGFSEGANVGAANDKVVKVLEDEVKGEGSPDGDVVDDSPVGRIQGDLDSHDDDEDGGHHAPDQLVIRRRVSLQRSPVEIRTCPIQSQ